MSLSSPPSQISTTSSTMFTIKKTFPFEASHQLVHHNGKCSRIHGHSYKLTVELVSPHLISSGPQTNMVEDFSHISISVKKLIHSHLDHYHLNDTLNTDSPTAEFIARWIFQTLRPALPLMTAVILQETETASVEYRPLPPLSAQQWDCAVSTAHVDKIASCSPHPERRSDDDEPKSEDATDI